MLLPRFKKFASDRALFARGDGVVLAVSGGVDSMVMLDLFGRLSGPWNLELTVAHVNYGLRGRASDADERFVRMECESRGVRFELLRQGVRKDENLQNEARRIRYRFLGETAARRGARVVATAHQMDDQAETILLHLIRGSGLRGLAGMSEKSAQGKLSIVRPLLFATRREIADYAKRRGVASREDRTNTQTAYTRNRIRHLIIPALEKLNPRIVGTLSSMGERLHQDELALDLVAAEAFEEAVASFEEGETVLRRAALKELPAGIRNRAFRLAFEKASGSSVDLKADQIAKMAAISERENPRGSYRLPSPWIFTREKDLLTISRSRTKCDRRASANKPSAKPPR
ncbi:MAG TPA: tRNA lysidine(34) synthetase TilS, partial [bacterium]|nr:tRNA lysidine(34) synthetase TilS [bacterium]